MGYKRIGPVCEQAVWMFARLFRRRFPNAVIQVSVVFDLTILSR
jgi:hypothetical protein